MRRLFKGLFIGLSLIFTSPLYAVDLPDYVTLKQGEVVTTSLPYSDTFYMATSNKYVCQVSWENSPTDGSRITVTITGVSPGDCVLYKFENNVLQNTSKYKVVSGSTEPFSLVPCYEFYSTITGDHYYTINEEEIKNLTEIHSEWGYVYVGIAYYVYKKND